MKKKIAVCVIILVCVIIFTFCVISISKPQNETEIDEIGDMVEGELFRIQPRFSELVKRLSIIGGSSVHLKHNNELDIILDRGKIYEASNLQLIKGEQDHCYKNCMALWLKNSSLKYITGYALADNEWVMHAWILNESVLVETTYPRDIYFGAELTTKEIVDLGIYKGLFGVTKKVIHAN